ncbi:MAG: orotidine-5'-phosphate decarboxylase [Vicinamibacteria bacterium]|jgi:orotidine-5'-phosphate decarboxylase|nr:orotidine-5'-phosphate decarboxylase [Vicinamibacteria bacterium]MBP9945160.1 orotidine-5'-phosphate decarboxylase [Vicinamibacteria bacterium]
MNPKDRLIVALDVDNKERAQVLVDELGPHVGMFKVGKELFTAEGPQIVRSIVEGGGKVFLDLKFHDIPNTVAKAVGAAAQLGAFFVTLHITGGRAMLEAAASALPAEGTQLLGVTVLTSHTDASLMETGMRGTVVETVRQLARLAHESGIDGVVCSPHEIGLIRETAGDDMVIVTPGIRPKGAAKGDQARVTTPGEALRLGCDYIVVGRPITEAASPSDAAKAIVDELSRG